MDNNMLMPLQQQLLAAHQEIRECNAYSSKFRFKGAIAMKVTAQNP